MLIWPDSLVLQYYYVETRNEFAADISCVHNGSDLNSDQNVETRLGSIDVKSNNDSQALFVVLMKDGLAL